MNNGLTKSSFLSGAQCLKRLVLSQSHIQQELKILPSPQPEFQKYLMSTGQAIGILARKFFPNGVVCYNPNIPDSSNLTAAMIQSENVIYEASFQSTNVFVAVDILKRVDSSLNTWDAYEVKSGSSVSEKYVLDAAIQYWTMKQCNIDVRSMNILHLNSSYVRKGELDVNKLFKCTDVTRNVINMKQYIENSICAQMSCISDATVSQRVLRDTRIGAHCTSPHPCPYQTHCFEQAGALPSTSSASVLHLAYGANKKWELFHDLNVRSLADIPPKFKLSPQQSVQVHAERTSSPYIELPKVKMFLSKLKYPLIYLDFEAINPAVPLFEGTHPYQQICFQYSMHIQAEPFKDTSDDSDVGGVQHRQFLADATGGDPRRAFVEQLLLDLASVPSSGAVDSSVVVYNKQFEAARLRELAVLFPENSAALLSVVGRLVDLAGPFQGKHVYFPAMCGKYSLKAVLPALVPSVANKESRGYNALRVRDGLLASSVFIDMMASAGNPTLCTNKEICIDTCAPPTPDSYQEKTVVAGANPSEPTNLVGNETETTAKPSRDDLLAYCEMDTWAMVLIVKKLYDMTNDDPSEV